MALGHHRDYLIETTLLFYTGQLSTMPAKLKSDDQRNILIRPLAIVAEKDLIELANELNYSAHRTTFYVDRDLERPS